MALTGCSSDSALDDGGSSILEQQEQVPVSFGTYLGQTPTTRAAYTGSTGSITSAQVLAQKGGFGVFAYFNDATAYSTNGFKPDFMYNQQVTGTDVETPTWSYTPIKYWPNDLATGNVDNQTTPAQGSKAGGMVSFFAYAPWVAATQDATPSNDALVKNGDTSTDAGIIKMKGNDAQSDPIITYVISDVDLLWGVANSSSEDVVGGDNDAKAVSPGTVAVNVDQRKQKTKGSVKFLFKHALAKIAGIKAMIDFNNGTTAIDGGTYDSNTKLTIVSVKLETENNESTQGEFNLATGKWTKANASAKIEKTWTSELIEGILEVTPTEKDWSTVKTGVTAVTTATAQNIFTTDPELFFIPDDADTPTAPNFKIAVEYIVRTKDDNLKKGWSEVSQTISKTFNFGSAFVMNKKYTLLLRFGLEDINLEGSYSDWDDTTIDQEVKLPVNVLGS